LNIETIPLVRNAQGQIEQAQIKVTGPLDAAHPVMSRARQMLVDHASAEAVASFDWCVKNDRY
jgi:hypothetical protein